MMQKSELIQVAIIEFLLKNKNNIPSKVELGSRYFAAGSVDIPLLWQDLQVCRTFGRGTEITSKASEELVAGLIRNGEIVHSFVAAGSFQDFCFHLRHEGLDALLLVRPQK